MNIPKITATRWTYRPELEAKTKTWSVQLRGKTYSVQAAVPETFTKHADCNFIRLILRTKKREAAAQLTAHVAGKA